MPSKSINYLLIMVTGFMKASKIDMLLTWGREKCSSELRPQLKHFVPQYLLYTEITWSFWWKMTKKMTETQKDRCYPIVHNLHCVFMVGSHMNIALAAFLDFKINPFLLAMASYLLLKQMLFCQAVIYFVCNVISVRKKRRFYCTFAPD